jgi:hypothetical protein
MRRTKEGADHGQRSRNTRKGRSRSPDQPLTPRSGETPHQESRHGPCQNIDRASHRTGSQEGGLVPEIMLHPSVAAGMPDGVRGGDLLSVPR